MEDCLQIHFKQTGEIFNVPYVSQSTTVQDLIIYVCNNSIAKSKIKSNDYYLAIDYNDVLDVSDTVSKAGLDQPGRFTFLQMCMKTPSLIQRINQARAWFWGYWSWSGSHESSTSQNTSENDSNHTISSNDSDNEIHILVCGGPKVGKSALINALCGCPVTKTGENIGLDKCTTNVSSYRLGNIHFWDTPGIETWSELEIDAFINKSTVDRPPLCMFYCASPGAFVKLKQIELFLEQCIHRGIYCVLVVTNMWANVSRTVALEQMKGLFVKYVESDAVRHEDGIWYYGNVGLCTMVNSIEFVNEDTGRQQPQKGINELILGVTKSLKEQHQLGDWLETVKNNKNFWLEKQAELCQLANLNA